MWKIWKDPAALVPSGASSQLTPPDVYTLFGVIVTFAVDPGTTTVQILASVSRCDQLAHGRRLPYADAAVSVPDCHVPPQGLPWQSIPTAVPGVLWSTHADHTQEWLPRVEGWQHYQV